MDFIGAVDRWIDNYEGGLAQGGREVSMRMALESLLEHGGKIIVETGSTRMKDDWGAGMATLVFGDYCKTFGGHLFTCDISHEVLEVSKEVTKEFEVFITYIENDSVDFLKNFNQKIDLLYLDSLDVPEYDSPESLNLIKSQVHQLREIEAAYDHLSDNPIVLLDDHFFSNGGKTRLSRIFLKEHGFTELMGFDPPTSKQSLWVK